MANLNRSITSVTSVIRSPFEPTVLRKSSPRIRASIKGAFGSLESHQKRSSSSSQSPHSDGADSTFSATGNDSTRKTSVNSDFSKELTNSSEKKKKIARRNPARSSPPEANLGTIEETGLEKATIETVERAAAAKIYLETYYNDLLTRATPRSLRRRAMEYDLWRSRALTQAEKDAVRRGFYDHERWNLRETRVLKWQSSKAAQGVAAGPYLDDFEAIKILGKGSFGVVRLVKEKGPIESGCQKQVYAMKVIRKSENLRGSQEGHLRAERDFLVASEDSDW
jgi:protein-serine/threonine kinase